MNTCTRFTVSPMQALNHVDVTFYHEYKVVMLRNRYHLVKTAAPDDSNDQQLLPDSDDELPSMQLRGTSGSEEDAPNTRRRIMRRRSPSSQRFCLADPIAMEGSSQEDTDWNTAHPAVADSFTAFTARSSHSQEGSKHSYQKCGSAHHAGMSPPGLLKASKWESVAVGQDKGSGVEQSSVVKPASANTSSHSISSADSASVAPKLMVQTELEQQQSSHTTEPQGCHMQTCMHSTRLHQQQQQHSSSRKRSSSTYSSSNHSSSKRKRSSGKAAA